MPSIDDATELTTALPEVTEGVRYGRTTWFVGSSHSAWSACAPEPLARSYLAEKGID